MSTQPTHKNISLENMSLPNLPSEWKWVRFSTLCERVSVGHVGPTTKHFVDQGHGVTLIRSQNVRPGKLVMDGALQISNEFHSKLKKSQLRAGDVLVVRVGANRADCCVVPDNIGEVNCANIVFARPRENGDFFSYYFQTQFGRKMLLGATTGAAQEVINTASVAGMPVPLPPKQTQRKIADALSAYDDLIENNRRRIALLEEAARLLYREWFVHFRFPGHEHVKIVDGVPDGWEKMPASQAVVINPRTAWDKDKPITMVPMGALSETVMSCDQMAFEVRPKAAGVKFRNGDTLFARITPCLENGKTGYVNFLDEGEVACGSTEFIVLRENIVSRYYTYLMSREASFRHNAIVSMVGSSGRQRVQPSCFDKYSVAVPQDSIAQSFDEIVAPAFAQIQRLSQQNMKLIKARDLLLPRLMDGRLEV